MDSIQTRLATTADAAQIAQVHYDALADFHGFYAAFFVTPPSDILSEATRSALVKPSEKFVVAEDATSNTIIGFIRYNIEGDTLPGAEAVPIPVASVSTASTENLYAPKEHMKSLWNQFNEEKGELDTHYEKASHGKRHYLIKHLMVSPAHQRKGIGARLLQGVLLRSDAEMVPVFLYSSAEAYRLYVKLGFEVLGKFVIDNERWAREVERHERELGMSGNEGLGDRYQGVKEIEVSMIRLPKSQTE